MGVNKMLESIQHAGIYEQSLSEEKQRLEKHLEKSTCDVETSKIQQRIKEVDAVIKETSQMVAKVPQLIDSVDDIKSRIVLHKRYVLGESWQEIAYFLGYSVRQTQRFHAKGLNELEGGEIHRSLV